VGDPAALVTAAVRDSVATQERLLEEERMQAILDASRLLSSTIARGGKLLLFGNGGSASDAAHVAAEFVGRFQRDRRPLPAVSLSANGSVLTAIANDFGFEQVFARQLEALGASGDAAIAISTSGRSANVLAGVEAARRLGMVTVGFTGADGGRLCNLVDVCLCVPASITARIQESHILLAHILCELVERELS
jgi:D-sedoheptulose 7-phosphate isomerase